MAFGRAKPRLRVYSAERSKGKNRLRESLTAAGQRQNRRGAEQQRQVRQQWQSRAFYFYDELGAIKYASQFYSRPLSKLRLYAAEVDENGEINETENPDAIAQLERIQDPGGGRAAMLSTYGQLAFLVGESLLFCSRDPDTDEEQWEFLSTDELRVEPGDPTRYSRLRAPSLNQESWHEPADDDYDPVEGDEAVAYRIWRRHPRYSHLADSPMRGVLEIAEELMLLTRSIRATARSRIANRGILLVPEGIGPSPPEAGGDEDAEQDPFLAELIEALTSAIVDESSASALAPILIRGDGEALDKVRHLKLVEAEMLYPEMGVRAELIKRLAMELDMPPEALLGTQDSNHWNAWMVDEQAWKDHQEPIAKMLVDDLTSAFFRPQLRELGVENWQKYRIAYDDADVVVRPDRSKDAKDLHDAGALSDEALRSAANFNEDDAPSPEEMQRWLGVKIRDSSLAVYGIPGRIPGGTIEPEPGVVETADSPGGQDPNEVVKGAPANGNAPKAEPSVAAAVMVGAAEIALLRAREKAGARLRSLAKRDPEIEKLLEGVATTRIAFTLGAERTESLRAPSARELVSGVAELFGEALSERGLEAKVVTFLGEQIEHHAARTLFEEKPSPLPPAFANYLIALQTGA